MQTLRRSVAVLASSAVAVSAMAIGSPSQAAPSSSTDATPAAASAQWLVGELNADNLIEIASSYEGETFSGPSYGTSVDLALALSAVGRHPDKAAAITSAVAANVGSYTGSGGEIYSGSSAKALALAVDQKRSVTDFGGVNLLARVETSVLTAGPVTGRLRDTSAYGDYANSIGQAFAARALTGLESPLADEVTDFLLDQQCEAGFFRLYFADETAPQQSCDAGDEPAEQSSDTTSLVAVQLAPLAAGDPEIAAALDRAGAWLASQQQANGSFVDPQNGANANTTGLAGWALNDLGRGPAAAKAAAWLRARQVVDICAPGKLKGEQGALAYDDQGWKDGATYGISDPLDRSQWVIADVQALPALLAAPAASKKDAVSLPKVAKAGSKVTAKISGVAAGERACTTGAVTRDLVGTGGDLFVGLAKAKAGKRTISLRTSTGTVSGTVQVLAKKKFKVRAAKQVKAGTKTKVTVRGLAAGEKVVIKLRGKRVAAGKANAKGVYTKKISVGRKRGAAKVVVTGQFATRKGAATIRVR